MYSVVQSVTVEHFVPSAVGPLTVKYVFLLLFFVSDIKK